MDRMIGEGVEVLEELHLGQEFIDLHDHILRIVTFLQRTYIVSFVPKIWRRRRESLQLVYALYVWSGLSGDFTTTLLIDFLPCHTSEAIRWASARADSLTANSSAADIVKRRKGAARLAGFMRGRYMVASR
ncbi:hypothetical protein [Rhizobium sp. WYJ-E13]|uniref:hypothetical protein n=1 Tax=Rhizobium sp. WYJ-E13 TaxID=2849093 RepID=UPI001C1EB695|nr:hypothetical protein [Rhizobium sp. WYJ-E13]QWW70520.1 hypothetical protein KQ933_27285 [Rhizobium sp. WYJ-E13]